MSKNIKFDKSESYIVNYHNGRQDAYYVIQVAFYNGKQDYQIETDVHGYYLLVCNVPNFCLETNELGEANPEYADLRLLVPCSRRSEKNFNLALEMMDEESRESIEVMEEDKRFLEDLAKENDIDVEEMKKRMKELKDAIEKVGDEVEEEKTVKKEKKVEKENKNKKKITFADVIGMQEIKDKLYDIIDQLNNKEKYEEWGIEPINGMILYGSGGTGKSLLSEALAGEVDAEFIKISTSDIMEKYVGASQQNVRKIFEEARKHDKCVLMIDEADGVFAKRNGENNKEHNNVVNEFLYQLSNSENKNIFVIATTNRIDIIDESIKRSGRFDYKVYVSLPDYETRKGILELNAKKKPLASDVNLEKIAKNMSGMNGADCSLLMNNSARKVLKEKRNEITQSDLEFILEEMVCGLASKTKKLDEKTKNIVATHEVGHLLMNELLNVNKTKKISILPHGEALGYLLHTNEDNEDVFLYDKEQLEEKVKVMLGGRANEELFFGKATTGASDDLQKANNLIRMMVTKYGYSNELGLLVVEDNNVSLQDKVNKIVKEELDRLYNETKELLNQYKNLSITIINKLKEKEELNGNEVSEIINDFQMNN